MRQILVGFVLSYVVVVLCQALNLNSPVHMSVTLPTLDVPFDFSWASWSVLPWQLWVIFRTYLGFVAVIFILGWAAPRSRRLFQA